MAATLRVCAGRVLGLVLLVLPLCGQAQEVFNLRIERKYQGSDCTSGYLAINGQARMVALERPWQGNAPEISSIPAGTYRGILRYDKKDAWRIQLDGVPGRTGVQIHIGNVVAQSKGCILVGTRLEEGSLCRVGGSAAAYGELKKAFYGTDNPVATPNKAILVTLVD